jgi:hypothetical protein
VHEDEGRKYKKDAGYFVQGHFVRCVTWIRWCYSSCWLCSGGQRSALSCRNEKEMYDSKTIGSGLKIGDEDIDWPVKSEGKDARTIQYPVEQTEGVGEIFEI